MVSTRPVESITCSVSANHLIRFLLHPTLRLHDRKTLEACFAAPRLQVDLDVFLFNWLSVKRIKDELYH